MGWSSSFIVLEVVRMLWSFVREVECVALVYEHNLNERGK